MHRSSLIVPLFSITTIAVCTCLVGCDAGQSSSDDETDIAGDGDGDGDGSGDGDGDGDGDGSQPGCEGDGEASQPFANHELEYADGSILPNVDGQAQRDQAVRDFYDQWRDSYLQQACGTDGYFVHAPEIEANSGDGTRTVSEGHGYGMMITAYMAGHDPNARDYFDALYRYYEDHPSEIDANLMAWAQDGTCNDSGTANSAADGDLDIAYALLLADKQWGSGGDIDYRAEAVRIIDAILASEVDHTLSYVRLGDWTHPDVPHYYEATRSSDFMPGHFHSFESVMGDGSWAQVGARGYQMVATVQSEISPDTGLMPDFLQIFEGSPWPAESDFFPDESVQEDAYSYNACRVPWRIAVHFLTSGDTRSRDALQTINGWIRNKTGEDPYAITAGYWLDGDSLPGSQYTDMSYVAPLGVGAMVDASNQTWLNQIWSAVRYWELDGTYYSDSLKLLSMIVMSGNWWAPESAPCP